MLFAVVRRGKKSGIHLYPHRYKEDDRYHVSLVRKGPHIPLADDRDIPDYLARRVFARHEQPRGKVPADFDQTIFYSWLGIAFSGCRRQALRRVTETEVINLSCNSISSLIFLTPSLWGTLTHASSEQFAAELQPRPHGSTA